MYGAFLLKDKMNKNPERHLFANNPNSPLSKPPVAALYDGDRSVPTMPKAWGKLFSEVFNREVHSLSALAPTILRFFAKQRFPRESFENLKNDPTIGPLLQKLDITKRWQLLGFLRREIPGRRGLTILEDLINIIGEDLSSRNSDGSDSWTQVNARIKQEDLENREKRTEQRRKFIATNHLVESVIEALMEAFPSLATHLQDRSKDVGDSENINYDSLARELHRVIKEASEVIQKVRETIYPGSEDSLGELNSARIFDARDPLGDILNILLAKNDVSERLYFEVQRLVIVALSILNLEQTKLNAKVLDHLHDLGELFDNHLVAPRLLGETTPITFYSRHDPDTLECLEISEVPLDPSKGGIVKMHQLNFRDPSGEIPPFLINPREKHTNSAIIKMIAKASEGGENGDKNKNSGQISAEVIHDLIGFKFITKNDQDRNKLYDIVEKLLQTHCQTNIKSIVKNHAIGNGRGQNDGVDWLRMTITFTDGVKGEIIFMTITAELNYRYMIDPDDHNKSLAHELYDIRRAERVAERLFPEGIYVVRHDDDQNIASIVEANNRKLRRQNNAYGLGS